MPSNATVRTKLERWQNHPEVETSVSAQIARRLWAGESISPAAMVAEYGCSNSLPGVIAREMRQLGWQISAEPDPERPSSNSKVYRLTGQGPELPERHGPRVSRSVRRAPSKITPTVLPPTRVAATRPAQYPPLGGTLQVRALAIMGEDVVIHLRDGNGGAWQAVISGYVEAE